MSTIRQQITALFGTQINTSLPAGVEAFERALDSLDNVPAQLPRNRWTKLHDSASEQIAGRPAGDGPLMQRKLVLGVVLWNKKGTGSVPPDDEVEPTLAWLEKVAHAVAHTEVSGVRLAHRAWSEIAWSIDAGFEGAYCKTLALVSFEYQTRSDDAELAA